MERIRTPGFQTGVMQAFRFLPVRVEYWFSVLQRQVPAHGSFDCVKVAPLDHNHHATPPPQWNTTADTILTRLAQICRTYEMVHWAHKVHP